MILLDQHNSLLRLAAKEIASFCIDDRLRQIAMFVFFNVGKGELFLKIME